MSTKTKEGRREIYWQLYFLLEGEIALDFSDRWGMCGLLYDLNDFIPLGSTVIEDYFPELQKFKPVKLWGRMWWCQSILGYRKRQQAVLKAIELTYQK